MNGIAAVLKLTRIEHSIMLVIAVVAAELIAGYVPNPFILVLSIITPIFVSMGSFAINDYYDVEADKANGRTDRPIVSGAISKSGAMYIALLCFAIGVIASVFINVIAFVIALIFSILAILYSYRLKDMLLVGNVYIALSMVIPFIYGNYVVSRVLSNDIILVSIMIFLAGLAREIHGMIRDYKGDAKARDTLNMLRYVSARRSSQLAFILYVESIAISIVLFFFYPPFAYNLVYVLPIALVDIVLAYVSTGYILQKKSARFHKFSRNASLFAMGVALIAVLLSAVFSVAV